MTSGDEDVLIKCHLVHVNCNNCRSIESGILTESVLDEADSVSGLLARRNVDGGSVRQRGSMSHNIVVIVNNFVNERSNTSEVNHKLCRSAGVVSTDFNAGTANKFSCRKFMDSHTNLDITSVRQLTTAANVTNEGRSIDVCASRSRNIVAVATETTGNFNSIAVLIGNNPLDVTVSAGSTIRNTTLDSSHQVNHLTETCICTIVAIDMDIGPRRITNNANSLNVGNLRLTVITSSVNSDSIVIVSNRIQSFSELFHSSIDISILMDISTISGPIEGHSTIDVAVRDTVHSVAIVGNSTGQGDRTALTDVETVNRRQSDNRLFSDLDSHRSRPSGVTTEVVVLRNSQSVSVNTGSAERLYEGVGNSTVNFDAVDSPLIAEVSRNITVNSNISSQGSGTANTHGGVVSSDGHRRSGHNLNRSCQSSGSGTRCTCVSGRHDNRSVDCADVGHRSGNSSGVHSLLFTVDSPNVVVSTNRRNVSCQSNITVLANECVVSSNRNRRNCEHIHLVSSRSCGATSVVGTRDGNGDIVRSSKVVSSESRNEAGFRGNSSTGSSTCPVPSVGVSSTVNTTVMDSVQGQVTTFANRVSTLDSHRRSRNNVCRNRRGNCSTTRHIAVHNHEVFV